MSEKKRPVLKIEEPFNYAEDALGPDVAEFVRAMGYIEAVIQEYLPNHDPLSLALYSAQQAVNKIIGHVTFCGIKGATLGHRLDGAILDDGKVFEFSDKPL